MTSEHTNSLEQLTVNEEAGEALFDRLGSVVRQLHDALRELGYERILDETLREITDSQDRLEYIATLTEQAANRVLNAVDEGCPIQDQQIALAANIGDRLNSVAKQFSDNKQLSELSVDLLDFIDTVRLNSEKEKERLIEIMMAQDFQDITGQIIKKVVTLTRKLEMELAQILKDYAQEASVIEKPVDLLAGPAVPDLAMGQNDVDDILADLGF